MTTTISALSKYHSLSPADQSAVRWGIWVLEGMPEELGFSEGVINTNPSHPSIAKAIKLFEDNGRNITPPQVKEDVHKMKAGIDAVHCGLSGRYSWSTGAIMASCSLTKEILTAVLKKNGHENFAAKLNDEQQIHHAMVEHETGQIYPAVMKMYNKITS